MLLLGLDIGTSSIKASLIDAKDLTIIGSAQYPEEEAPISSPQPGWAEQAPGEWWNHTKLAIASLSKKTGVNFNEVKAIGISYQMHGLVAVNKEHEVLRPSIIWCDSRAVEIGNKAFDTIGHERSLERLLNSPGNFTASKLAWVKQFEKESYEQIEKVMLPGDYIAMKLTGDVTTSISALSEGIFWDFRDDALSEDVFGHYEIEKSFIPEIRDVFSVHGRISGESATELGLPEGIPVTYKAGDQPNNALSLNVLKPGEVAATAGTSGVIYAVTDTLLYDKLSRVNTFAHVNYTPDKKRLGVLLCINGTGILNRWAKNTYGSGISYKEMNELAGQVNIGSDGITVLPFGNGAERILNNEQIGAHILNLDLNRHTKAHIFRAVQEGIAFAFRYGLDIMRENGIRPEVIRAGNANMFQSPVFRDAFVNVTGIPVELYENDGSVGAAIGAGVGAGLFNSFEEAFSNFKPVQVISADRTTPYEEAYTSWKADLEMIIESKSKN